MAKISESLYGNVPDKSPVVLLLIDVINDMDFEGGDALLRHALPMGRRLASLKARAKKHGCAVIYVNDNFGRWRSDFHRQVRHCLEDDVRGNKFVELLKPDEDDYFVLKPAHSAFYSTTLELLLKQLDAHTLIITGVATNICIQFTANDAFLRGYEVVVPVDCVAANTKKLTRDALTEMQSVLKAEVPDSKHLNWSKWISPKSR